MLDFAEAGHWERALILLLSCARLVRVQNLVLGTAALRSSEIPPRGGPGARGLRPLGEKGCFWTTFLGSDPSKPGISFCKKGTRDIWVISPTRLRLLRGSRFCLRPQALSVSEKAACARRQGGSQATSKQASNKQASKAYRGLLGPPPPELGISPYNLHFIAFEVLTECSF